MNKIIKHSNYVKSLIDGFTSLILPTFQLNSDIKTLEKNKLTNYQQLRKDYAKSTRELRKTITKM